MSLCGSKPVPLTSPGEKPHSSVPGAPPLRSPLLTLSPRRAPTAHPAALHQGLGHRRSHSLRSSPRGLAAPSGHSCLCAHVTLSETPSARPSDGAPPPRTLPFTRLHSSSWCLLQNSMRISLCFLSLRRKAPERTSFLLLTAVAPATGTEPGAQ